MLDGILDKIKNGVEEFISANQIIGLIFILSLFVLKMLNVNDDKIKDMINKKGKK